MENFNELKHQILDCGDYFGWRVTFFEDDSVFIQTRNGKEFSSERSYEAVEKTFNDAIDNELSQMTFSEPLSEYKFQIEHFMDLAKYFGWDYCITQSAITVWVGKDRYFGENKLIGELVDFIMKKYYNV